MEDIHKFRIFNKLKSVYRFNSVDDRKESSAEHSWSCLILADYFITKHKLSIDRLKIYELLMYHDVVEIETGDLPLHPDIARTDKKEKEKIAKKLLHDKLPEPLNDKFIELFTEFEEQNTKESRFAKAIDALEAEIHELDYKEDWKGWTEEFLRESKLKYIEEISRNKRSIF
jgi:putative hydrolases of HD superfamily